MNRAGGQPIEVRNRLACLQWTSHLPLLPGAQHGKNKIRRDALRKKDGIRRLCRAFHRCVQLSEGPRAAAGQFAQGQFMAVLAHHLAPAIVKHCQCGNAAIASAASANGEHQLMEIVKDSKHITLQGSTGRPAEDIWAGRCGGLFPLSPALSLAAKVNRSLRGEQVNLVGTSRCDVRAACSGATLWIANVARTFVPPATPRVGTAQRATAISLNRSSLGKKLNRSSRGEQANPLSTYHAISAVPSPWGECLFSRSAAVLGSSNVSTPRNTGTLHNLARARTVAPEDGRTP